MKARPKKIQTLEKESVTDAYSQETVYQEKYIVMRGSVTEQSLTCNIDSWNQQGERQNILKEIKSQRVHLLAALLK